MNIANELCNQKVKIVSKALLKKCSQVLGKGINNNSITLQKGFRIYISPKGELVIEGKADKNNHFKYTYSRTEYNYEEFDEYLKSALAEFTEMMQGRVMKNTEKGYHSTKSGICSFCGKRKIYIPQEEYGVLLPSICKVCRKDGKGKMRK